MAQARTIGAQALQTMLHDHREIALLDVREAGEFGESHLLFATSVPYSRLEVDVARLVPRRSVRIVLCDDGKAPLAQLASCRLQALGYADVAILEGGTRAWAAAGYTLFAGVNVPSKLFGELVEHVYHTPRVTAQALVEMREAGEDVVVVDGRPFTEYQKMSIPGAVCCPNAELPYRIKDLVKNPATKIVVNCAGRTRSIIGAQTLINFGVPNPVYALENGTQGWFLADLDLGHGAHERYVDEVDPARLPAQQRAARELAARHGVKTVTAAQLETWFRDETRTTYVCDVRTENEYAARTLSGAVHAPGGQLIQATDQWVGVRNARIVLVDNEAVRAPVVAAWLVQMGWEACVLEGGIEAAVTMPAAQKGTLPRLDIITTVELGKQFETGPLTIFDLRSSTSFRKAHIRGSRWSIRPRLVADAQHSAPGTIVLVADEQEIAAAAAIDLREAGFGDLRVLEGGFSAWQRTGLAAVTTPHDPPDKERIDYLFFVHDRHDGNREAARQYLAWETNLMSQLSEQDRSTFKVGALT